LLEAGRAFIGLGRIFGWQEIALDPSFWQALGKALGWNVTGRQLAMNSKPNWQIWATRFYDLILTGGDTEKFWADLLQ
jgi:hypothetical protein